MRREFSRGLEMWPCEQLRDWFSLHAVDYFYFCNICEVVTSEVDGRGLCLHEGMNSCDLVGDYGSALAAAGGGLALVM
jgi:hypothetical protein